MTQKKSITYCGKSVVLECDGLCIKAWGLNSKPTRQEAHGIAPKDPGTYEGGEGKPLDASGKPENMNKWCARECERSSLTTAAGVVYE